MRDASRPCRGDSTPGIGGGGGLVAKSYLTLATPWTVNCQAPLSMGFPRQENWSGLPLTSPGILLTQGLNLPFEHCRQILYH